MTSARTGQGIDELLAVIEERLPKPEVPVDVTLPYDRGDLVDRLHKEALIDSMEHNEHGTHVVARVRGDLADELAKYV